MTELCLIMKNEGSDKGGGWHNYTEQYFKLFNHFRDKPINFFEMGLGTNFLDIKSNMGVNGVPGASLRGWKTFFTNANVYGADIDTRILFTEPQIQTFYCDQTDESSVKELFNISMGGVLFDVIIDDGLHEYQANKNLLIHSFKYLKSGGYYIIEDLLPETIKYFES
jgi:hypothetical protein